MWRRDVWRDKWSPYASRGVCRIQVGKRKPFSPLKYKRLPFRFPKVYICMYIELMRKVDFKLNVARLCCFALVLFVFVSCADTGGLKDKNTPLPSSLDLLAGTSSKEWRLASIRSTDASGLIIKYRYQRTEGTCRFDDAYSFSRAGVMQYLTGASLCDSTEKGFEAAWEFFDNDTRLAVRLESNTDTFNFRTARNELLLTDSDGWIFSFQTAQ